MEMRFGAHGETSDVLTLAVREGEWSVRISTGLDPSEPSLLLSLPRGLFVRHDGAMRRLGAHSGPAVESDPEYLSALWGFTRLGHEGDLAEIDEVPLIGIRALARGLSVDLAGCPWLAHPGPLDVPEEWRSAGGQGSCLLGICFELDLCAADADERFLQEASQGRAVLGQVSVVSTATGLTSTRCGKS
ncbi:hypothetical protein [Streptomyces sp. AB3(2024)]|uniref:hypothetical protein n=1 Tax=Streptomyces sp. AB3(2024) TaxID=3317321 RepID=UPI0035A2703B